VKICIVSDSHDRADPLLEAVSAARLCGARAVIHCGDVIGTHTLRPLLATGLPLHVVHGNNVGDVFAMQRLAALSQGLVTYHGAEADLVLAGRRIHVTHMPHLAHAMACTGEFDLVCCGHAHAPSVAQQPNIAGSRTWLVNPGTVAGIGDVPATWILGDLETMVFEVHGDE
jgi:putative phosphoesterase